MSQQHGQSFADADRHSPPPVQPANVIIVVATVAACIAAIVTIPDLVTRVLISAGAGVAFSLYAGVAYCKKHKKSAAVLAMTATAAFALTLVLATLTTTEPGSPTAEKQKQTGSGPTTTTYSEPASFPPPTQNWPTASSPAAPTRPTTEGYVDIAPDQAIDFEVAQPQATPARGVIAPYDIHVDSLRYGRDHIGYIMLFSGNPNDGLNGCKKLLNSLDPRPAEFTLPNKLYCAETSEGNIVLLHFIGNNMIDVSGVNYRLWRIS